MPNVHYRKVREEGGSQDKSIHYKINTNPAKTPMPNQRLISQIMNTAKEAKVTNLAIETQAPVSMQE